MRWIQDSGMVQKPKGRVSQLLYIQGNALFIEPISAVIFFISHAPYHLSICCSSSVAGRNYVRFPLYICKVSIKMFENAIQNGDFRELVNSNVDWIISPLPETLSRNQTA